MNSAPRRILLFLACAIILLAAGYLWGASRAYDQFYSPEALLDRELVHLDFNTRVLHYVNQSQPAECRRKLVTRLRQQMIYVGSFLAAAPADARADAARKLQQAQAAVAGQPPAIQTLAPVTENNR